MDEAIEAQNQFIIYSVFRDIIKIFSQLPNHIDIEEIFGEFALYFVPPEHLHEFHKHIHKIILDRKKSLKGSSNKHRSPIESDEKQLKVPKNLDENKLETLAKQRIVKQWIGRIRCLQR